ncbi:MAG: hypothetical protein LC795_12445 [Acidobacteria bacterium]|nr:hypothetical protein [Acidobacteriota bacterium]
MTTSNKVLPVALVAALLGGTVGAFVMRPSNNTPEVAKAEVQKPLVAGETAVNPADEQKNTLENELADETKNMTEEERAAFRDGFMEGVEAARESNLTTAAAATTAPAATRVVQRSSARRTVSRNSAPRRVYYDYGQTKGRSFWQKHRDKLTVAMGAGGGAVVGGLVGGKKGAAIGALAGGGGSALYTYKLRKRNRNY